MKYTGKNAKLWIDIDNPPTITVHPPKETCRFTITINDKIVKEYEVDVWCERQ